LIGGRSRNNREHARPLIAFCAEKKRCGEPVINCPTRQLSWFGIIPVPLALAPVVATSPILLHIGLDRLAQAKLVPADALDASTKRAMPGELDKVADQARAKRECRCADKIKRQTLKKIEAASVGGLFRLTGSTSDSSPVRWRTCDSLTCSGRQTRRAAALGQRPLMRPGFNDSEMKWLSQPRGSIFSRLTNPCHNKCESDPVFFPGSYGDTTFQNRLANPALA
jgi:hypothetical protein